MNVEYCILNKTNTLMKKCMDVICMNTKYAKSYHKYPYEESRYWETTSLSLSIVRNHNNQMLGYNL